MDLRKELEQVRAELAAALNEQAVLDARIEGLRAQERHLERANTAQDPDTAIDVGSLTKGKAIVEILKKSAPQPMTIHEIAEALKGLGKYSKPDGVSVYMTDLVKAGSAVRVGRGSYSIPPAYDSVRD